MTTPSSDFKACETTLMDMDTAVELGGLRERGTSGICDAESMTARELPKFPTRRRVWRFPESGKSIRWPKVRGVQRPAARPGFP